MEQDQQLVEHAKTRLAYAFNQENPFMESEDPFHLGMELLCNGDNLSVAALAFEVACQQNPKHPQAWKMLGSTQAENEKEAAAVRAFEQALQLNPEDLDVLMGLAISCTNDGNNGQAYETLERWLGIKYPQLMPLDYIDDSSRPEPVRLSLPEQHTRITNLFIEAAQICPSGDQMDPDIQVGLGVLCYSVDKFSRAADCFSAALSSTISSFSNQQSQTNLLWNRLGASLENMRLYDQAIEAYETALAMNPNFVRATNNLAVLHYNKGSYGNAVKYTLQALAAHQMAVWKGREIAKAVVDVNVDLEQMMKQNHPNHLYTTLRKSLNQLGRWDLADRVGPDMDIAAFRLEYDFWGTRGWSVE